MPLFETAALALLLGITEFLPVPASAHLALASQLLGWDKLPAGLLFSVHVGLLLAVVSYYLADLVKIFFYFIDSLAKRKAGPVAKIAYCLLLASLPAAAFWFFLGGIANELMHSIKVIAWATLGYGVLLGVSSYVNRHLVWRNILNIEGERHDSLRHVTFAQAILIGCAQVLAFVPGTSRCGITLTAGLFLGLRPEAAARFSYLLSIPALVMLSILEGGQMLEDPALSGDWPKLIACGAISLFAGLACIHLFMKYISKPGIAFFVAYRCALGVLLLFVSGAF